MLKSISVSFEVNQSGDSPILPPENPKPQNSVNFDPKNFSTYYFFFKLELKTATQEDEQQQYMKKLKQK